MTRGDLTDDEWALVEPYLPLGACGPIPDLRNQFNAVMWRFRTGSPWRSGGGKGASPKGQAGPADGPVDTAPGAGHGDGPRPAPDPDHEERRRVRRRHKARYERPSRDRGGRNPAAVAHARDAEADREPCRHGRRREPGGPDGMASTVTAR
ncbi:transposase [Actinoallomurus purpureus]|uniref:transposase n=1 Tax=Actinoallomurus purpureus TaxID=478114 RepID=UPI0035589E76